MGSIEARGLVVAFAAAMPVLRDVSFHLGEGWHGLVGANGAGKTTLLRVLAGELSPDDGAVVCVPRSARVVLCQQRVEAVSGAVEQLAASNTAEANEMRGRLRLEPSNLSRWESLSPGERKRWQIGAALASDADVLLLDEPTNHLDGTARALLVGALRRFRGVGIVVSHDRAVLDELPEQTLRLHDGVVTIHAGGVSRASADWSEKRRALLDEHAAARARADAIAHRLADARRQHAAADRLRSSSSRMRSKNDHDARGGLAKGRANSGEARRGRMVGVLRESLDRAESAVPRVEKDVTLGSSVFATFSRAPGRILFHIDQDVRAGTERDGPVVLSGVRLTISREDRVRIEGDNGAGKSSLLRALLASKASGREDDQGHRILVLPQEMPDDRVARDMATLRTLPPEPRGRVLAVFAALGSDPERLLQRGADGLSSLSPGEARKLALALGLGGHAWALVLDEPTNHLDLPTVERLEGALAAYPGAIVLVSHDDRFARAVTTRSVRLAGGAVTT
jgi:ATPase subunit of ABC transporter with duplicated ATPase domains